jgi:hypothetical protein
MKKKQESDDGIRPDPELEKARGRIGLTIEANARWLLHFADLKLEGLSQGDFLNLQYEVWEYGRQLRGVDRYVRFVLNPASRAIDLGGRPPSLDQLRSHQHFVQQILEGILQAGGYDFKIPTIEIFLFKGQGRDPAQLWMLSDDYQGPFKLAVALALQPVTHRIRRCPECDKRFLADRANQDYDSPGCQSRAAMRRYRKAKGLVTGRRRGRPPKQSKKGGA